MTAHYLRIERKHRQMGGLHASLADFSVTSGDAVTADIVRTNPASASIVSMTPPGGRSLSSCHRTSISREPRSCI